MASEIKDCVKKAVEEGDLSELHHLFEENSEWDFESEHLELEESDIRSEHLELEESDIRSEHLELSHYTGSGGKQTALHLACIYGHLDIVDYLVYVRGYSVSRNNSDGHTPLVLAWKNKHLEIVLHLVTKIEEEGLYRQEDAYNYLGISIECIISRFLELGYFGENPLRTACNQNLLQTLRCLCKLEFNSSLHHSWIVSRVYRDFRTMQLLLRFGDTKLVSNIIQPDITELHKACLIGDTTAVMKLIKESMFSLEVKDQYGMTPVHYASCEPDTLNALVSTIEQSRMVQLLYKQDAAGNTPMHYAVINGYQKSIEAVAPLWDSKLINVKNFKGHTLLHLSGKQLKMLLALLKYQEFDIINECDTNGETVLHIACRDGSLECIRALVQSRRCNANIQSTNGSTALHVAIICNKYQRKILLQCILECDEVDLNIRDHAGQTPLHLAVVHNDFKAASILLTYAKCDPNLKNNDGNTPFHVGVAMCSLLKAEPFLSHSSIDFSIQNEVGNTPLHEAVIENASVGVVKELLHHNSCDPYLLNENGMTPLQCATTSGKFDFIEAFLCSGKYSDDHILKSINDTLLLHKVVSSNKLKPFQTLLTYKGCHINETDQNGKTALHIACRCSSAIGNDSRTAYLILLLAHPECNPNVQDFIENTPAHLLVRNGSLSDIKQLLLHPRIDLRIQNLLGNTPLHDSVNENAPVSAVEALLHHNSCDPYLLNENGMTPLQCATTSGKFDFIEAFLCSGKYSDDHILKSINDTLLLHKVVSSNKLKLFQTLLTYKGCHINETDQNGKTALHIACRCSSTMGNDSRTAYLILLLAHPECNPNVQDFIENTPAHLLVRNGSLSDIKQLLLHPRIDLRIQNLLGNTPLHDSVNENAPVSVVEALLHHNSCDPYLLNENGMTPLQCATTSGKIDFIESFICSGEYSADHILKSINDTLLLHKVVSSNKLKLLQTLLTYKNICINETDNNGETALHLACRGLNVECVRALIQNERCDPNIQLGDASTALHVANYTVDRQEIVQYLLESTKINPNIKDNSGQTPLHIAVVKNHFETVSLLVKHSICEPNLQDNDGNTALHLGVGSLCTVELFLSHTSININIQNNVGITPLHEAVIRGSSDVVRTLVLYKSCDPQITNFLGETPLHSVCRHGYIESCLSLLQCKEINVLAQDRYGNAPIHIACQHQNEKCLEMLLDHKMCNPNQTNHEGDTPLHILCSSRQPSENMISMLLSIPELDHKCVNHHGQTPLELVPKSNTSIITMISKYLRLKQVKLETYLKIFVLGNSGNGKSTLIKAITTEVSKLLIILKFATRRVNPRDVPPHTAGIVPIPFNSKHFGHAVLYDFAGQHEYYSSHAAVIENLILPSPPLFLLLIDISKPMEKIKEELMYWWLYIDNHCQRAIRIPHAILVGSHKDIARLNGEDPHRKMKDITQSIMSKEVSFTLGGYFLLDCRKLASKGLTGLLNQLRTTCQTLRETADIDLHCNILKAFCVENFDDETVACTFSDIIRSEHFILRQNPSRLISLLSTLSDKGHILLLQNHTDVNKSWVILKPSVLLTKVNGSIFAPQKSKEQEHGSHNSHGFAMEHSSHKSTGVVALTNIKEKFSNVSHQVITGYLTHMEYCFQIKDQHTLELITNDPALKVESEEEEVYYFFPGLVQTENPKYVYQPQDGITYFECGWLCKCYNELEQLTTRFLHVLILRLAFSCQPPDDPTVRESVVLLRSCSVWKHGIAWWTNDGIETIVEVGLQCRWVAVMMRCPDTHKVQCAELRSKVIATVLKTKTDSCPAITMNEFLIAPSSLQYPFQGRELTLYSITVIANVVINGKDFATDIEGKNPLRLSLLLPFEPYFSMGSATMHEFFSTDQSRLSHELTLEELFRALTPNLSACEDQWAGVGDSRVRTCVALFHNLQRRGCKTWRDFEREFSRVSIFCGRNPLVSSRLFSQ